MSTGEYHYQLVLRGNVPSKKNSKMLIPMKGRTILALSPAYRKWRIEAGRQFQWAIPPIKQCEISIRLYAGSRRKADLTNKAESIMDLLVEKGVIADDNFFVVPRVELIFMGVDALYPKAIIEIRDLGDDKEG